MVFVCPHPVYSAPCVELFRENQDQPASTRSIQIIIESMQKRVHSYSSGEPLDSRVGAALVYLAPLGLLEITKANGKTYTQSNIEHPGASYFADLTYNEVVAISLDADFRKRLAQRISKQADENGQFQINGFGMYRDLSVEGFESSLLLISRALLTADAILSRNSGKEGPLSRAEFRRFAEMENIPVRRFGRAFRYDSRSPSQILQAGGFYPNKDKPLAPLSMHSTSRSSGAAFVSLSTVEGNAYTVSIPQVILAAKIPTAKEISSSESLQKLATEKEQLSTVNQTELRVTYEYAVESVDAAVPLKGASVAEEAEIVVPFLESGKIVGVRTVYILSERVPVKNVLGHTTGIKTTAVRVLYGTWKPLYEVPSYSE